MTAFVESLAPYAMKHGKAFNVLPSLIIAQGILESARGTSELAQYANNLFGIKKGTGWDGEVYPVITGEYRKNEAGEDEYYEIVAEFRKYDSYEGAVIDLCKKYTEGLSWEKHNRYAAVPGNYDFALAANAVKAAGYATDPAYPEKLIRIYGDYGLATYDTELIKPKEEEPTMFKVVIDVGHGYNTAGKRSPIGEREWSFNNKVALACIAELNKYQGVEVLRVDDATGRTDVPLSVRTAKANAWKADIYVSIHHNANTGNWGTWTGTETYVYTSASNNSVKLAKAVHPRLVSAMGLRDRGIKRADFHVVRETAMPAILTEGGYMDSTVDIIKMRSHTTMVNAGKAIAQGIVAYAGLKPKVSAATVSPQATTVVTTSTDDLYRVRLSWTNADSQLGAFSDIDGAKRIAEANNGYKVYDAQGQLIYDPAAVKAAAAAKAAEAKALEAKLMEEKERLAIEQANAERDARARAQYDADYQTAVSLGITDGSKPLEAPTREQVAVMIVRALNLRK